MSLKGNAQAGYTLIGKVTRTPVRSITRTIGNADGSWTIFYSDGTRDTITNEAYMELKKTADAMEQNIADIKRRLAALAKISSVTLLHDQWEGNGNLYSQVVSIDGVTVHSQVDITPDVEQIAVFYEKDLTFVTENEDGVVTVYAIGQKPENDYTIQVTITEVSA
jgi:hypothetical protein